MQVGREGGVRFEKGAKNVVFLKMYVFLLNL
jgi:hypothetical protein